MSDKSNLKELNSILEADPYSEISFARVGYTVKTGDAINENPKKVYIYIDASEDFFDFAEKKFSDIAVRADKEIEQRVVAKIIEEEEKAQGGFGSIFE